MRMTPGIVFALVVGGCGGTMDAESLDDAPEVAPAALPAGMTPLFDGKDLEGWLQKPARSWDVEDAAMHGLGVARGFIYTDASNYGDFRLLFSVRHLPTTHGKNHAPCVLLWGSSPNLDALGGIQFQPPNGGHWDYRPGHNSGGGKEFTSPAHPHFDNTKWSQCEIVAHKATGKVRMACCTLTGPKPCTGIEVLDFDDPTAARNGPIAWQVHNGGLHDEFKDVSVERNPASDELITTRF